MPNRMNPTIFGVTHSAQSEVIQPTPANINTKKTGYLAWLELTSSLISYSWNTHA